MTLGLGLFGLICGIGSAQTFTRLIQRGDPLIGGGPGEVINYISRVDINNQGDWACEVVGNGDSATDNYVLVNGNILFEEGTTTGIATPAGSIAENFYTLDINDHGDTVSMLYVTTPGGQYKKLIIRNGVTIYESGVTTCIAPGSTLGWTYGAFLEVWQNNNDQLLLIASAGPPYRHVVIKVDLDPTTGAVTSETLLARHGRTLPGSNSPVQGFWADQGLNGITDSGDAFYYVDKHETVPGTTTLNDSNIYVNTALHFNQADPFPTNPTETFGELFIAHMDFNSSGDYVFSGYDSGQVGVSGWIFKSVGGVISVLAHQGDPVPASIGGGWNVTVFGAIFGQTTPMSESGDVLWYLSWDHPDYNLDSALMFNDRVVLREGVTVLDGFTMISTPNHDSDIAMSDDGSHAIVKVLVTGGHTAVYMIQDMGGSLGAAFCDPSNTNSTGASTTLSGFALTGGGISGGQSDLHLECTNGVPSELGFFLVGTNPDEPGIVVSNGNFCLSTGPFFRYSVAGGPSNSFGFFNAAGVLENAAGTSSVGSTGNTTGFDVPVSIPGSSQTITAGSTWHFQVWHRDTPASTGSSNFSNGLSVTF